jgi:hypothetical protein
MKYTDKKGEFTPEYCKYIYAKELEEMYENKRLGSDKWKNDLLLIILMKAEGTVRTTRKKLRRKVFEDVRKECKRVLTPE